MSSIDHVRTYHFHRWLNPFREESGTYRTDLAPQEVSVVLRSLRSDAGDDRATVPRIVIWSEDDPTFLLQSRQPLENLLGPALELEVTSDDQTTLVSARLYRVRGDLFTTLLGVLVVSTAAVAVLSFATGLPVTVALLLATMLGSFTILWFVWIQWRHCNHWRRWNEFITDQLRACPIQRNGARDVRK